MYTVFRRINATSWQAYEGVETPNGNEAIDQVIQSLPDKDFPGIFFAVDPDSVNIFRVVRDRPPPTHSYTEVQP